MDFFVCFQNVLNFFPLKFGLSLDVVIFLGIGHWDVFVLRMLPVGLGRFNGDQYLFDLNKGCVGIGPTGPGQQVGVKGRGCRRLVLRIGTGGALSVLAP